MAYSTSRSSLITTFTSAPTFSAGATFGGDLDMGNNLVLNIGAAGTDFTAGGGLTLAGILSSSAGTNLRFAVGGSEVWSFLNSSGALVPTAINVRDIGTATIPIQSLYAGTSVQSGITAALDADVTGVTIIGTPAVFGLGSSTKAPLVAMANGATTAAASLPFIKTRSTGTDANTAIVAGDGLALIPAYGADGTSLIRSGSIRYVNTGTVATTRVGGKWEFYTGTDAAPTVETLALTLGADQTADFASSISTSAPNGGTAGEWKLGIRVAATTTLDTSQYLQVDIGGTLYKVGLVTS